MTALRERFASCGSRCKSIKRQDLLLPLIITGAILGFLVGALISNTINSIEDPEERKTTLLLIGFPGELLLNMLRMIVLPLIIASLITALSSLDSKSTGKIGRRVLLYYLVTTVCASVVGIIMVVSIRPGRIGKEDTSFSSDSKYRTVDSFLDLFRYVDRQAAQAHFLSISKQAFIKFYTGVLVININELGLPVGDLTVCSVISI